MKEVKQILSKHAAAAPLAHVAIVLDRSGSMESCRDATINGFNEFTQTVRNAVDHHGLDARLTLTVFNDEVRMPLFEASLDRLLPLNRKMYVPDSSTAMLDAVGKTIRRLERHGEAIQKATVLVCIISDGEENASTRYSYSDIAETIQRLTKTDRWTFTYLGSNQDLAKVADSLSIPIANMQGYDATPGGTARAWDEQACATTRHIREASLGHGSSTNFYGENREEAP